MSDTEEKGSAFTRAVHWIEAPIDRLRPPRAVDDLVIDPYVGYSVPGGIVVRGRVLTRSQYSERAHTSSRFRNFFAMLRNFLTREVGGVAILIGDVRALSDEEGYFSAIVPRSGGTGMTGLDVRIPATGYSCQIPVFVTPHDAEIGIISDIDDTIMHTGTWRLYKNIWNTMTGSVDSRRVFADTVALINKRQAGRNPVFYVSSSPWNLHAFLTSVFAHNGVVPGPKFLKDFGITPTQLIKSSHGAHKSDAIDTIITANPNLTFVLIGDTGQHDAEAYLDAVQRHEDRIGEVCLRMAGPFNRQDAAISDKIRATGVKFFVGETFDALLNEPAGHDTEG